MHDRKPDKKLKPDVTLKVTCQRCDKTIDRAEKNRLAFLKSDTSEYCNCTVPVTIVQDTHKDTIAPVESVSKGDSLSAEQKKNRNMYGFTGLILILGSVLCFCYQQHVMNKAKDSLNWPVANGTIVRNELRGKKLALLYKYKVADKEYTYDRFYIGFHSGSLSENSYVVKKHPTGSEASVYYNPKDPGEACLNPGLTAGFEQFSLLTSGLLFLFGLIAICVAFGGKKALDQATIEEDDVRDYIKYGHLVTFVAKATKTDPEKIRVPVIIFGIALLYICYLVGSHFGAK